MANNYKTLKKQLYNRLPDTTTVTKVYMQNGMQDLTLNPVYRGPVYDPISIVRKQTVRREAAKRVYDEYVLKQQAKANSITDVAWGILSGDFGSIGEYFGSLRDAFWNPKEGVTFGKCLMHLGTGAIEDLDVLANPIKGLFVEGAEGLKKATIGDEHGVRHNYSVDVTPGSYWDGPINLVLEVVLDPVNWISFGGKAAASAGIKGLMSGAKSVLTSSADDILDVAITAGKTLVKEGADDVAEEVAEGFTKEAAEAITKNLTKENMEILAERTIKETTKYIKQDMYKAASERTFRTYGQTVSAIEQVWVKNAVQAGLLDEHTARLVGSRLKEKILAKNIYDTSFEVLKGVKGAARFGELLDSGIFKTAMWGSGAGEVWALSKWGYNKLTHKGLVKTIEEAYKRATAFGAKHWHRFKTREEYLEFVAREFNGDPQLKAVVEAMGKDPSTISFHELLGYKLDIEAAELADFIKRLDPTDPNALVNLDAFVKKTYGYETYKEFVNTMTNLPGDVLRYADSSFKAADKAYSKFAESYVIAKNVQTAARRAEVAHAIFNVGNVVKAQDEITAQLIPAVRKWRKTGDLSDIYAIKNKLISDVSEVIDGVRFKSLIDEDVTVVGEVITNINGVNTKSFIDDTIQNINESFQALENTLKNLSDKQKHGLRQTSELSQFVKQWYNNTIDTTKFEALHSYFEKYSTNYKKLAYDKKAVYQTFKQELQKAKQIKQELNKITDVLKAHTTSEVHILAEQIDNVDTVLRSLEFQADITHCLEVINDYDIISVYKHRDIVELRHTLQVWEDSVPHLLTALKENPTVELAQQLVTHINTVTNTLETGLLHIIPDTLEAKAIHTVLVNFKQLRAELGEDFTARVLDLETANKLYQTKLENVYNVLTFMQDADITDTLRIIASGTGNAKGKFSEFAYNLNRYIQTVEGTPTAALQKRYQYAYQAAKKIQAMATKFTATVDLFDDIQKLVSLGTISTQQANSILSTLLNFSTGGKSAALTCTGILNDFDVWFDDVLMNRVQLNYTESFKRSQALRQEALFKTYKDNGVLEKYGHTAERYTHSPVDDATVTGIVIQEELSEEFNEYLVRKGLENHTIVCIDTEANGLLEHTGFNKSTKFKTDKVHTSPEVFEIGTVTYTAGKLSDTPVPKKYFRQYGANVDRHIPDATVMNVIGDPKLDYAGKVEAFKKGHSGPSETLKDYYTDFLEDLLAKGDNIVLVSFNGTAFDMQALLHQFKVANVDVNLIDRFTTIVEKQHYDAYVALKQKLGYYDFTEQGTEQLKRALKDYLEQSAVWRSYNDLAFHVDVDSFVRPTFLDKTYGKFFDNIRVPQEFKDLIISKKRSLKAQAGEINYILDSTVFKKLYVDDTGKALAWDVFSKNETAVDVFTSLTKIYASELGTSVLNKQTYEALCGIIGTDPNLSTLLFRASGIVNPVGYKKAVDVTHVRTWFDLDKLSWKTGAEWTTDELAELEKLVYDIEAKTKVCRNKKKYQLAHTDPTISLERIKLYQAECVKFDSTFKDNALMHLKLETQSVAELEAIEELYDKALVDMYTQAGKDILTDPDFTRFTQKLPKQPYELGSNPYSTLNQLTVEPPSYKGIEEALYTTRAVEDGVAVYDALDYYSMALEANELISAAKLAQAKTLNNVEEMLIEAGRLRNTLEMDEETAAKFYNVLGVYETSKVLGTHNTPEALLEYMITHKAPLIRVGYNIPGDYGAWLKTHIDPILDNQEAYKAVGLSVVKDEETGFFYIGLSADFKIDYNITPEGRTVAWEYKGQRYERTVDYLADEADWDFSELFEDTIAYDSKRIFKNEEGEDVIEYVRNTVTKKQVEPLFKSINNVREHMSLLTNGASRGHINGILTEGSLRNTYAQLPREFRQSIISLDALTESNFWSGVVFDGVHLGGVASRPLYGSADYVNQLAKTAQTAIEHASYSNLYLDFLFNADTSIAELCTRLGDEEVLKMIQKHSEDYRIIFLTQSPRAKGQLLYGGQGYAIRNVSIDNIKDLRYVKEHCPQAILVPTSIASEMTTELTNTLLQNNPLFKAVRGLTYAVKTGLILTTGKVMRDGFEGVTKNAIEVGNMITAAKGYKDAPQVIMQYYKAMEDILELSVVNRYGYKQMIANGIDPFEFAEIYLRNRNEAIELVTRYFDNVDDILKLDANKCYTDVNKKLYFKLYGDKLSISEDLFDELHGLIFSHEAFDMPTGVGRKMLDWAFKPMAFVDQLNRVSEYLALRELCTGSPLKAAGKVMATHFDAAVKSNAELIAETFIPFFAFLKRNTIYWTKAMAEHPWLARLASDYVAHSMGPYHDCSEFELSNNTSLQAALLNGAVAIGETESGDLLTFKLNIPFMSAWQMYRNPIGTLAESSSPALQYLIHRFISSNSAVPNAVVDVLGGNRAYNFDETGQNYNFDMRQLIPIAGPWLNKYGKDGYVQAQVKETGSKLLYLNSVFGRAKRFNTPRSNASNNYYKTQFNDSYKRWQPTMSIPQYKYLTGQYGSSYSKGGRSSVYARPYNKQYYVNRNRQHQRYYKNNERRRNAEYRSNQRMWALQNRNDFRRQQTQNMLRYSLPKKMNWRVQQQIK